MMVVHTMHECTCGCRSLEKLCSTGKLHKVSCSDTHASRLNNSDRDGPSNTTAGVYTSYHCCGMRYNTCYCIQWGIQSRFLQRLLLWGTQAAQGAAAAAVCTTVRQQLLLQLVAGAVWGGRGAFANRSGPCLPSHSCSKVCQQGVQVQTPTEPPAGGMQQGGGVLPMDCQYNQYSCLSAPHSKWWAPIWL